MWYLTEFGCKNFISHKDTRYALVNNELTMIYGINEDVNKKKSNGSGKSVLLDIISFSITGDCLRKVNSIKEVINNQEKDCWAYCVLENKLYNKKMRVERTISTKSSQKIVIYLNDEEQSQLKDLHPRESDKFIEEELGISFDDLMNYYIISKFRYQSLFLANDKTKKEVINRFSKADIVDNVFPLIDNDIDSLTDDVNALEREIVSIDAKICVLEEQKTNIKDQNGREVLDEKLETIRKKINDNDSKRVELSSEISSITSNIEICSDFISDFRNDIKFIDEKIENLEKSKLPLEEILIQKRKEFQLVRPKYKERIDGIKKQISDLENENQESLDNHKEYDSLVKEFEAYLRGEIECPKCKHHFVLNQNELDVDQIKKDIEEFKGLIEQEKARRIDIDTRISLLRVKDLIDVEKEIENEERSIIEQGEDSKAKIAAIDIDINKWKLEKKDFEKKLDAHLKSNIEDENKIKRYEFQIERLKEENVSYENQITTLENDWKNGTWVDECKKIEDQIQALLIEKEENQNAIVELNSAKSKKEEWKSKFKRFKSFLANQSIYQIQDQSNYFLSKMKSDLIVFIDGFRELSNKKIKEEITVELSRDGINGESFGKFSGGEKSTADLSCILSMQNIINLTSHSGGLNFLGIDEILESVDEEGMNDIIYCLNNLKQTIVVIAHSKPNNVIECNKVFVQKKDGISKIVENAV